MKIEDKTKVEDLVLFKSISEGECFRYNEMVCVKGSIIGEAINLIEYGLNVDGFNVIPNL